MLAWIAYFLQGRRQRAVVAEKKSAWADILSGIPQGSVRMAVLFVIFINDLPHMVRSIAKIFADDTKLYEAISTPQDALTMQEDLNHLAESSVTWQLHFNETKCKVIHLGSNNARYAYQLNGAPLTPVTEKDLGVYIEQLTFHVHVTKAVGTASRMLGRVRHTLTCLYRITVPLLFNTIVRPHLKYGNVIWHPRFR